MNSFKQHGMSFEEYIKEFKQLFKRCDVSEMLKQAIIHLLGGINREIFYRLNFNQISHSKMFANWPGRWRKNESVARVCRPNLEQGGDPSLRVLLLELSI